MFIKTMNCYQYKIVCQVKYEVLTLTNHIQVLTLQNMQKGTQPQTEFATQYSEKLAQLQELLLANSIQPENFNLATFATECLQNADIHMNSYIQTCKGNVSGTGFFKN